MEFGTFEALGEVTLTIPAWLFAAYVAIISIFLLAGRLQLCLLINYLFVLYVGFIVYAPNFIGATGGDIAALSLYVICGLATVVLAMVSLFHQPT